MRFPSWILGALVAACPLTAAGQDVIVSEAHPFVRPTAFGTLLDGCCAQPGKNYWGTYCYEDCAACSKNGCSSCNTKSCDSCSTCTKQKKSIFNWGKKKQSCNCTSCAPVKKPCSCTHCSTGGGSTAPPRTLPSGPAVPPLPPAPEAGDPFKDDPVPPLPSASRTSAPAIRISAPAPPAPLPADSFPTLSPVPVGSGV